MSRKQFEAWARSKGADDISIATIDNGSSLLAAMWSAWQESRRQIVVWNSPDKPPTAPYGVLVTIQVPDCTERPRLVREAFYMAGKWHFLSDMDKARVLSDWPVLAWAHKPGPFYGDAP